MWEHEIDPDNIPSTPWRNYRLYDADGTPLRGYYSLDSDVFALEGHPMSTQPLTREEVHEDITKYNEVGFGPVTLRALRRPDSNPPLDALRRAVTGRIMTGRATPIEAIED